MTDRRSKRKSYSRLTLGRIPTLDHQDDLYGLDYVQSVVPKEWIRLVFD